MSGKLDTLKINAFTGVDRRTDGTITPNTNFFSMTNWHPKSLGELESLKGVAKLNASALPGVDEVIHVDFHTNPGEDTKALVFFKPDVTGSSDFGEGTVSATNFSITGTGTNFFFYVQFTGAGGLYKTVAVDSVDGGAAEDSFVFTLPVSGIPDWVCQINIFYKNAAGLPSAGGTPGSFAASLHRVDGVFPASGTGHIALTPANRNVVNMVVPEHSKISDSDNTGSLIESKTYYVGVAAAVAPRDIPPFDNEYTRVRMFNTNSERLSFTVPEGASSVDFRIHFPFGAGGAQPLEAAEEPVERLWGFLGQSPEDLAIASSDTNVDGFYTSVELIDSSVDLTAGGGGTFNAAADVIFASNPLGDEDESPVQFNGTNVAGLVSGNVYWLKFTDTTKQTAFLATSLENLRRGIFVDLTATGAWTDQSLYASSATFTFDHMPTNTNNNVNMTKSYLHGSPPVYANPKEMGGTYQEGDAFRFDGLFVNSSFYPSIVVSESQHRYLAGYDYEDYPIGTDTADNVGIWVCDSLDFGATKYQLLANVGDKSFSRRGQTKVENKDPSFLVLNEESTNSFLLAPDISPALFWQPDDDILSTTQFTIRTYVANGNNILYLTDGYVFKPLIRDFESVRIPTSKYVQSYNSRLVAAGGDPSFQNSPNQVYYSESDNPFDWGTSAANSLNVFTPMPINGLGAYSQNLLESSFASFLVISKEDGLFTWDGNVANGPTQLYYSFGFAGPNAFAVTEAGPLFVARDSVYLLAGEKIIPFGDEIEFVLKDLSEAQLKRITAVFHDDKFKLAYSSAGTSTLDTEWWIEANTWQGKPIKYISGPHLLTGFSSQASTIKFDGERDVRLSVLSTDVYQRDSGKDNNGADIDRVLLLNRLGLKADHYLKLLERIYLAVKMEADESFDLTLDTEDGGTLQYTGTLSGTNSVASRQMLQHFVASRILGRVNALTIENSSSNSVSLFDVSLLFMQRGRRLFR